MFVRLGGRVKSPYLDDVVAATGDKATVNSGGGARRAADNTARGDGGSPRDRVDTEAVGVEGSVVKGRVLELENADVSVRRGAG